MMILGSPVWLLLVVPLAVVLWLWPAPSRLLQGLRIALLTLIVLAMCAPMLRLPSRAGTVVVVADRSLSMPSDAQASEIEIIRLLTDGMGANDRLAVVSFGQAAAVERAPDVGPFPRFVHDVAADGSNLSQAIEKALTLFPADGPGRMIVLSDARWTGNDPIAAAGVAASRAIPIDYRHLGRSEASDIAISSIEAPLDAQPGEMFMISAWVQAPVAQRVRYELRRDDVVIAQGERGVVAGANRLVFRERARQSGVARYSLHVVGDGEDPVPENNTAKTLVGTEGPRPLLYVTEAPGRGLPNLLAAGGLDVHVAHPADVAWSLEKLAGYSGVLIENVPAASITEPGMANLAQWVQETGAGLMMTGGRQSFGPGGYFKSPLDAILPVSMELRQEHRKFSVAIAIALDRSGSMSAPVGGGRTKMDLANLGTAEVAGLLSPMDEIGVIAVDSSPHVIVPMGPVTDAAAIQSRVRRIQSQGGGIFVYEALEAAVAMLGNATPQTRHIILFSDAMDSENPADYKRLVDDVAAAGVTVSVIGLGTEADADADLLKDIAARGNGRVYFTSDATELPRLFAQDTFVVARSSFISESTPVRTTGGLYTMTGQEFADPPAVGGYNLAYIRPEANLAAVTADEYAAPLIANWQAGAGRVVTYTGEADGQHTGAIAGWPQIGDLMTSLARWTTGNDQPLPGDMVVRQRVTNGGYRIELHLDPRRAVMDLDGLPAVSTLMGRPGSTPRALRAQMQWRSPHLLTVDVPLTSDETALSTIDLPGHGTRRLMPVALPYSPEFEPPRADRGLVTLDRIARATGGENRIDIAGIWNTLPRHPRYVAIAHWLLIAGIVVLLIEVLERRTGLLAMAGGAAMNRSWQRRAKPPAEQTQPGDSARPAKLRPSRSKDAPATPPSQTPSPPEAPPPAAGMEEALRRARRNAGHRTGKRDKP